MFKSVVWSSTIDYPNQVSTVLFVGICNWDCKYCYNRNLINNQAIDFNQQILPKLIDRKTFINHIVISGGECTCYDGIGGVIKKLKEKGFIVGIHTNGSNFTMLKKIIHNIDFIGMDIKTSTISRYEKISNSKINFSLLCESVKFIIESNIQYEFRTTLYPLYVNIYDCIMIAKLLKELNADKYVLQQYDNTFGDNNVKPYSITYLRDVQKQCNKIIPTILKGW